MAPPLIPIVFPQLQKVLTPLIQSMILDTPSQTQRNLHNLPKKAPIQCPYHMF
jgi:hypothetical protein